MLPRRFTALILLALLAGCAGEPEAAAAPPEREPASSEVLLSAVDARTGAALTDPEVTVRYLVRAPITIDAADVKRVSSSEPYRIVHAISADSLVVELRLEAPSYERLDTVLAVARGATGGSFKVALSPRAARTASAPAPAVPAQTAPARVAARPTAQPAPGAAAPSAAETDESLDASVDRGGLRDGDAAFGRGDWRGSVTAYRRMVAPRARRGAYARDYQLALVRLGISLINLGQMPGARDALSAAAELPFREYTVYFYLGQVECSLGQFDTGRRTLGEIPRLASNISDAQRPIVLALTDYQRAVCSHVEYQQARTAADAERTAARALEELEAFVQRGGAMRPVPAQVSGAVTDAQKRMREIAGR
jgi:hypothetical protein